MEVQKVGIKETKEALIGINEVALFLCSAMSDGTSFSDFIAFYDKLTKDVEFQKVLRNAWEGRERISEEMSNVDIVEGMELLQLQIGYVPKFLEAFKKKPEIVTEIKE